MTIPLKSNSAGQYVVNLMDREPVSDVQVSGFAEVMLMESKSMLGDGPDQSETSLPVNHVPPDATGLESATEAILSPDSDVPDEPQPVDQVPPAEPPSCWVQEDCGCQHSPWLSKDGPAWSLVSKRVVIDGISNRVLASHEFNHNANQRATIHPLPDNSGCVITKFYHRDPRIESHDPCASSESQWRPSAKQGRQLTSQMKSCHEVLLSQVRVSSCLVQEVFSPPRFAVAAEAVGLKAASYDLKTGYDLSTSADRKKVEIALEESPPELLVLCPPCTDEGGWFHLNSTHWDRMEYLRRVSRSRSFIRWCCKLFRQQAARGKRAMFEHPTGAKTWSYPEVRLLLEEFFSCKLHMCRYDLRLPGSERPEEH